MAEKVLNHTHRLIKNGTLVARMTCYREAFYSLEHQEKRLALFARSPHYKGTIELATVATLHLPKKQNKQ